MQDKATSLHATKKTIQLMKKILTTVVLTLAASALTTFAQAPAASPAAPAPVQTGATGKPAREGRGPGHNPIIAALDANHDGVIDAQEIANAPTALKALDKNGDGQITREELRAARSGDKADDGTKNAEHPRRGHKKDGAAKPTT